MSPRLLILLTALLCTNAMSQTQLGTDINGSAGGDFFGQSVALSADGTRVIIGAPNKDSSGQLSGQARVLDWNGVSWIQAGLDLNGAAASEYLGYSVSISDDGSRIALGARGGAGYVSLFDWTGDDWLQVGGNLVGEANSDYSGYSIDLSSDGSRAIIGAPRNDGNGTDSGQARVYQWSGTSWLQLGLDIDGEASGDESGNAVAISSDGSRIAVGAALNDGTAGFAGHVRIYDWSGSAWVQAGADIDGEAENDRFGTAVDFSTNGNRVAIGGKYNDGSGADAGHVRIYDWNDSDWVQVGSDIDGELDNDSSGMSVALSSDGNRVAIGAWGNDGSGSSSGHVRVYDWDGVEWAQYGPDINGETSNDNFGTSVALSSNGQILAAGAIHSDGDASDSGDVRVFDLTLGSGLIAYYPFEGNANDESGMNRHGTVFGATLTTDKDGNPDSAYLFDGIDDYIDVGNWFNGGAMSFTFWARWDAYHNYSRIIDLGNGASADNIVVSQHQSNDELFFSIYIGTGETRMWTSTITMFQWDFYAATVDDSGIMTLYKNGQQIAQKPDGVTPRELLRTQQFIGRSNFSQDRYFEGAIDELRIYDWALTEADIRVLYGEVEETIFRDGFEAADTD